MTEEVHVRDGNTKEVGVENEEREAAAAFEVEGGGANYGIEEAFSPWIRRWFRERDYQQMGEGRKKRRRNLVERR